MTFPPARDSVGDQAAHSISEVSGQTNDTTTLTIPPDLPTETRTQAQPEAPAENGSASVAGDRTPQNPQAASMPNHPFHQTLPPELQSLLAGVLAAVGAPPNAFQHHFGTGQPGMPPDGNSRNLPNGGPAPQQDQGQPPAAGVPSPPAAEDPRAFFRQQFAQFAEALRQTSTARADPERAEELLRGLKDPGQTVLRRLVRICEVEDARGESNEGVQCGICLDTITEIFERVSTQETCPSEAEVRGGSLVKEADETGASVRGSTGDLSDTGDKLEMKDVEMLVDGQEAIDVSERTTFKAFPCHHLFCGECLLPWLSTHTTCPTCRLDIDPHSVTLRRPINRQRRSTSIRPTTSRSVGERNSRIIAGTPSAWRFLRPSGPSQETPPPGLPSPAADLPLQSSLHSDSISPHRILDTQQPASESPRRDHNAPMQTSASPQQATAVSNGNPSTTGGHNTGPMGNMTIVFLTGNPPGSTTPSEVGAEGPAPVPPNGSTGHEIPVPSQWADRHNAGGPMFLTIDVVPDPPSGPSNPSNSVAPTQPAVDGPLGSQTFGPIGAPQPMAPPTLFAFPPPFLGMANPFAPSPGDLTYTRSSAIWTPPTPKNSLEQWLLKRERELSIVCDDPHCKYICPDVISNFDDALIHVQAFGSHDQLCEHKHHMTCLVEGNQSTGWYRMINQEAKQAALRCLQCRNHGWTDVHEVQSDS